MFQSSLAPGLFSCHAAALFVATLLGGCAGGDPSGSPPRRETEAVQHLALSASGYKKGSQAHYDAVNRRRRVWINDDGNDIYSKTEPTSQAAARSLFLKARLQRLKLNNDNDIDTVVYETTGGGFAGFFHPNSVGDFRNWDTWYCNDSAINKARCRGDKDDPNLLAQCKKYCTGSNFVYRFALNQDRGSIKGIDPLSEAIAYVHKQQDQVTWPVARPREIFWGIRMNDTHDTSATRNIDMFLYSTFKEKDPINLFAATLDASGKVVPDPTRSLSAGKWASVRYENIAVRRVVLRAIEDVLKRYDVDGIQLNFMRHGVFFRRNGSPGDPANATEIGKMTTLMRDIREATNNAAEARLRPVLISILVPDSRAYAKYLGLDLETWYKEGLVDLVVGSDYMQLQRWGASVAETTEFNDPQTGDGVRFYAGFTDTRLEEVGSRPALLDLRETAEAYRGRALEALAENASGMQLSNAVYGSANFQALYSQIGSKYGATGSADNSSGSDLLQFASFTGRGDNPGSIPNYTSFFSSYYRPAPQPSSTSAAVAAPDAPWKLPAGKTKRWEFRIGRGNHQKRAYIYLRTETLNSSQRDGDLYVQISNPTLGNVKFTLSRYYPSTPAELIDPTKFKRLNGRDLFDANGQPTPRLTSDVYKPRMLGYTISDSATLEALLSVPTLKVDVVNASGTEVSLEDVFVHATLKSSVPNLISGVHPF